MSVRALLVPCFFVSGFCGLLYQTVWLRLAFAHFGVIAPVVSVVVSTFMLGLALGSWQGGVHIERLSKNRSALTMYGIIELIIASGAILVPALFDASSNLLLNAGETNSVLFLAGTGLAIAVSILPFAIAMGATYPVAMRAYQQFGKANTHTFGLLYSFNTAGALLGCAITVFILIELLGFRSTLLVGAALNIFIAIAAILFSSTHRRLDNGIAEPPPDVDEPPRALELNGTTTGGGTSNRFLLLVLFSTGFCSMAMEVSWVRLFAPILWQSVYTFGFLLCSYLLGNTFGAALHSWSCTRKTRVSVDVLLAGLAIASCLPVIVANPAWVPYASKDCLPIGLSVGVFAAVLGWLTPKLVDTISASDPHLAGKAYAMNIAGCIGGPLVAGYLLIPTLGGQISQVLMCIPFVLLLALHQGRPALKYGAALLSAILLAAAWIGPSWEEDYLRVPGKRTVFRDYAATTIAVSNGGWTELMVNGTPMTTMSPITKLMAHLSFVLHGSAPKKVLVICLGMGSTYRAALSWGTDVTVVDLIPGVAKSFSLMNKDRMSSTDTSRGRIIIDDGRRYLSRTNEKFDVIIVDPPPPPQQPTSSLLYSTEFYDLIKKHLRPDGVFQAWWGFPNWEPATTRAMINSAFKSFPYTLVYRAIHDPAGRMDGFHILCSLQPLKEVNTDEFLRRMPAAASEDLQETCRSNDRQAEERSMVDHLLRNKLVRRDDASMSESITDDAPFNEYFFVRLISGAWRQASQSMPAVENTAASSK